MISFLLAILIAHAQPTRSHFQTFFQNFKENSDYKIFARDSLSSVAILAIHGGRIEPGTSELAKAIAREDFKLYLFEGIRPAHNQALHLTSSQFDEPKLLELLQSTQSCVSIHGYAEPARSEICVGGGGESALPIAIALKRIGQDIIVRYPCQSFEGINERNVVNRGQKPGVQIELSSALRKRLAASPDLNQQIADAIRGSLAPSGGRE